MNRLGFLCAVAASILFGVGGTCAQFLFQRRGISIDWLVTMRLLCAGSVLLLIAAVRQRRAILAVWRGDAMALIVFGLCGMLAVQYTYMAAIDASNTATATVLQFTAPTMIAIWLAARARRWPCWQEVLAVALAMLGTLLLVTHGRLGLLSISALALFWGLASAVAAAFNSIQPVALLKRYGASVVAGWGMLIGGFALSFVHPPWAAAGRWDATAIFFTTFIFLAGTLTAFYLYIKALQLIGAQNSSLLTCAEPLSAALLSVWWLGVAWSVMDWIGAGLILVTIVLLGQQQMPEMQAERLT